MLLALVFERPDRGGQGKYARAREEVGGDATDDLISDISADEKGEAEANGEEPAADAAQASAYEGVQGFHLKDHFPLWEGCWSFFVNADTVIKHRFKGGRYAGYNNAVAAQTNIITGHTHVLACQPITGYAKTIWGVQTGTLAEPNSLQFADYTEDSPKDWRSGFVMLSWERGKMLMPEMIQVCGEDEVEFRGEILKV